MVGTYMYYVFTMQELLLCRKPFAKALESRSLNAQRSTQILHAQPEYV